MMKLPMSPAAASLLRALLSRAGVDRQQVLLVEFRSVDWQSLTFIGERHEVALLINGRNAANIADSLIEGLNEDDLVVPGHIVADIALVSRTERREGKSVELNLEALTIAE